MRKLFLVIAMSALCSCAGAPVEDRPEEGSWRTGVKEGSQKVASATVRGAEATVRGAEATAGALNDSARTAYRGVKDGFAPPDEAAYGPQPRDYVTAIRKHMLRYEGVSKSASFVVGKPVRAYTNKGLMRGGDVEWQGWVVDVDVETKTPLGQPDVDQYVVRVKDDEVVEVIERTHATALRRVGGDSSPGPAAPGR